MHTSHALASSAIAPCAPLLLLLALTSAGACSPAPINNSCASRRATLLPSPKASAPAAAAILAAVADASPAEGYSGASRSGSWVSYKLHGSSDMGATR